MIIFLNGAINAGKSTIAKLLAGRMPNSLVVEPDKIREQFGKVPIDEAVPKVLSKLASTLRNESKKYATIIVPYPLSQENADFLLNELGEEKAAIKLFTLDPGLEVALGERGARKLSSWEVERIKKHYAGAINLKLGTVIDNSKSTPEETAGRILAILKQDAATVSSSANG